MIVMAQIEAIELEGDCGGVDGVQATCSRCGHQTECFGTEAPSHRRALLMLREECPRGESNYYKS